MPFFELRDPENRIREVQLVYREVLPCLYNRVVKPLRSILVVLGVVLVVLEVVLLVLDTERNTEH